MNTLQDFSWVVDKINNGKLDFDHIWIDDNSVVRDRLFKEILESFQEKPIKVFQIGAIESLENKYRIGSGWSDIFFGSYIKKYGGMLTIVDMCLNHIANSNFLSNQIGYEANFIFGDANNFICPGYDIYYLDGADISYTRDAYNQTLSQFKKIENTNCIVFVDDVPSKGKTLIQYLKEKNIQYTEYKYGNGMVVIDLRRKNVN